MHGKVKFQEWWEMKLIVPRAANLFVFTKMFVFQTDLKYRTRLLVE
jgi:hypothetical protein